MIEFLCAPIAHLTSRIDQEALIGFVWLATLALATALVLANRWPTKRAGVHLLVGAVAILLVVAWRVPTAGAFFHGLEYEDSYVYTVVGRQLALDKSIPASGVDSPYLTTVCAIGSVDECWQSETYSGHYIGYPYAIAAFANLFGYRPTTGNEVSLVASCISVLVVLGIVGSIRRNDWIARIAAGLVFAATPVFAVHGVGSYAEPVSSTCVGGVLLLYLRCIYQEHRNASISVLSWSALILCLLLAVTIKRENTVLAIALPLASAVRTLWGREPIPSRQRFWLASVIMVGCGGLAFCAFGIGLTAVSETAEYGQFPFSPARALELLPLFFDAFRTFTWYGGGFAFVLVGAFVALRSRDRALYPLTVGAAYLALYATHVRHFYQLHGGDLFPDETLRYSMNAMLCWSVLAGCGVSAVVRGVARWLPQRSLPWTGRMAAGAVVLWTATAYSSTSTLREALVRDEYEARIRPALAAAAVARGLGTGRTIVITPEPLVVQMYGESTLNVMNLSAVEPGIVSAFAGQSPEATDWLYVKQHHLYSGLDRERYGDPLAYLGEWGGDVIQEEQGWSLVLLPDPPVFHRRP